MTMQPHEVFEAAYLAQSGEHRDCAALRGITKRYLGHAFVSRGERDMIERELEVAA